MGYWFAIRNAAVYENLINIAMLCVSSMKGEVRQGDV